MSGKAKRVRGEGSSSARREERLDYERDIDEEIDVMMEGEEVGSDDDVGDNPMYVPPMRVFKDLDKPLPSQLPKVRASRAKRVTDISNHYDLSDDYYCSFRFVNQHAHRDALTDSKLTRKGAIEKKFPIKGRFPQGLVDLSLRESLLSWWSIVEGKCSSELTREILVNIRHWKNNEARDRRHIFCRGKYFVLDPPTIARVMKFTPLTAPCAYFAQISSPNCLELVSRFCFGENPDCWRKNRTLPEWRVAKGALKPQARWVCELLENWVLGISQQPSYSFKLCTLAYCVYIGARVNIPWFIYESIMERTGRDCEKGPGHSYLFLALIRDAGISTQGITLDTKPFAERRYEKIPGAIEDRPPRAAPRVREEPGSSSGTPTDMAAIMAYMQEMRMEERAERAKDRDERHKDRLERDRQFAHVRANQRQLGGLVEMTGQWQRATYQGTPDPPPPSSSPWYDSDEYIYPTYEQYEQAERAGDSDE